jgi:hypothetical protein
MLYQFCIIWPGIPTADPSVVELFLRVKRTPQWAGFFSGDAANNGELSCAVFLPRTACFPAGRRGSSGQRHLVPE